MARPRTQRSWIDPRDRRANYLIVTEESTPAVLVIKDVGPWNAFMTVTNAADKTCAELWNGGLLRGGRRLLYYDSLGQLGEIIHKDGVFVCFGHVEPE